MSAEKILEQIDYHTIVVSADLEGLVSSHDQACLAIFLVLQ